MKFVLHRWLTLTIRITRKWSCTKKIMCFLFAYLNFTTCHKFITIISSLVLVALDVIQGISFWPDCKIIPAYTCIWFCLSICTSTFWSSFALIFLLSVFHALSNISSPHMLHGPKSACHKTGIWQGYLVIVGLFE